MDFIYVILITSVVFFSLHLTNNNKKFKPYLYIVSTLFGIFSIIVFAVLAVDVIRGLVDNSACTVAFIFSFDSKSANGRKCAWRHRHHRCSSMDFSCHNSRLRNSYFSLCSPFLERQHSLVDYSGSIFFPVLWTNLLKHS